MIMNIENEDMFNDSLIAAKKWVELKNKNYDDIKGR
jgi:hypothetical protein